MIEQDEGMTYAFDGKLIDVNGQSVVIDCRIKPPLVAGDMARIELSVPVASKPVPNIQNPCKLYGQLTPDIFEIKIDIIWYKIMPQMYSGRMPIKLTYAGYLHLIKYFKKNGRSTLSLPIKKSIKFFLNKIAFFDDGLLLFDLSNTSGCSKDIFVIDIPDFCKVRFSREWAFLPAENSSNVIVKSGFCAVIYPDNENSLTIEKYLSRLEDALIIMSVFSRQRITVLGWEVNDEDHQEQVWKDPLEPTTTRYVPYEPNDYLVEKKYFESLMAIATKAFDVLNKTKKDILKHISVGLSPFIEMQDSARFLLMFHALEACSSIAPEILNSPKLSEQDMSLISILEASKKGVSNGISSRIDGFINIVKSGSSLKKLELVLKELNVTSYDLWPLSGTDKLPGIKEIRNKIAHNGTKNINNQGLAVATWHLGVLLERLFLALLKIPMAQTSVSPSRLCREEWYNSGYVLEQRKTVILANGKK